MIYEEAPHRLSETEGPTHEANTVLKKSHEGFLKGAVGPHLTQAALVCSKFQTVGTDNSKHTA